MSASELRDPVPVRRLTFDWTDVDPDGWHTPLPEFGAAANALSLLFPHGEAYVISVVRAALAELEDPDPALVDSVRSWAEQEAAHLRAHKQFNDSLTAVSRMARVLDRAGKRMFSMLKGRSAAFGLAYAAAFEVIAFCSARWAEEGLRSYFGGAEERAASLFLWHLAEEIEHKGIPHDVLVRHERARMKYRYALPAAFVTLIGFTVVGGLLMFMRKPHALNPMRWARLIGWGISYAFVVMPVAAQSLSASFHPSQLVDPPWMAQWLSEFDSETKTLPLWTDAGLGAKAASTVDVTKAAA